MKTTVFTLTFCLFALISQAQSVDLDKFAFNASYRVLPRKAIDTSYHTFSVKMEYGRITRISFREEGLEEQVQIAGWKQLPYQAHIDMLVKFEDIYIDGSEVKEKVQIFKDKTGKETGRKITYVVQVAYSFAAEARVTDFKGRSIQTINLGSRDQKRTYTSEDFPSTAEANAWFKFGIISLTSQLTHQSIQNAITDLNGSMTYNYGYSENTVSDILWILDSRKHPEYDAHRRACVTFKQIISQMSYDEPLYEVKKQMQPVIEYFNSIKKRYNSGSKGDRKLRYSCYYNLAKIHYYLDNPDAAIQYSTELKLNGYDAKDGNSLEAAVVDLKFLLKLNKLNSRHFPLNVDDFNGPYFMSSSNY